MITQPEHVPWYAIMTFTEFYPTYLVVMLTSCNPCSVGGTALAAIWGAVYQLGPAMCCFLPPAAATHPFSTSTHQSALSPSRHTMVHWRQCVCACMLIISMMYTRGGPTSSTGLGHTVATVVACGMRDLCLRVCVSIGEQVHT